MPHLNSQDLRQLPPAPLKIFFYRICGTGMGATACLLKEMGHEVAGGDDRFAPPMGDFLQATGIPLVHLPDYDLQNLKDFDLVIIGNVVARQSTEAQALEQLQIKTTSFPAALGALVLAHKEVIGVSGTHGKTTTTYLFEQVFRQLGMDPGYFIGAVLDTERPPAALGSSDLFFIEADEYDSAYFHKISKFRFYELDHLVITSLEFDHGDIFANQEEINAQFYALKERQLESVIYDDQYAETLKVVAEIGGAATCRSYGKPVFLSHGPQGCEFEMPLGDKKQRFRTNLVGEHNILNLQAVIHFAHLKGFTPGAIQDAIASLHLARRRQEVRGTFQGAMVIDDFAHHPRAIEATLKTLAIKYPQRELLVVLEPASATARSGLFQERYPESLRLARELILIQPQHSTTLKDTKNLDCDKLVDDWQVRFGRQAFVARSLDQLLSLLESRVQKKHLLAILSNSTCLGLWSSDFAKNL